MIARSLTKSSLALTSICGRTINRELRLSGVVVTFLLPDKPELLSEEDDTDPALNPPETVGDRADNDGDETFPTVFLTEPSTVEEPTLSLDKAGLLNGFLTTSEPDTADVLKLEPTGVAETGFPACKAEMELRRISGRDLRTGSVTVFSLTVFVAGLILPSDDKEDRCLSGNPPVLFLLGTELAEEPIEPDLFVAEPDSGMFRGSILFFAETEPDEAVFMDSEDFFFSDSNGTSICSHKLGEAMVWNLDLL